MEEKCPFETSVLSEIHCAATQKMVLFNPQIIPTIKILATKGKLKGES
jgi:hypothetical protein